MARQPDSGTSDISQRDLRTRSKQIMDAVEQGQSFVVTRDGRPIGELIPIRRKRRFISREEFTAGPALASTLGLPRLSEDLDDFLDTEPDDPYLR